MALQKLVVNTFMEEFGVIAETPGLHVEDIHLDYVLVKVNDAPPYAVPNGSELRIGVGDEVMVTDIVANFNRGLTADFVGMGSHNDTKLPFRIAEPTKVLIRKDAEICGSISLATTTANAMAGKDTRRKEIKTVQTASNGSGPKAEPPSSELRALQLLVNVDGTLLTVEADGEIEVQKSKLMVIKGVHSNISRLDKQILFNLKGFSPQKHQNIGNDINFPFSPGRDLWARFSEGFVISLRPPIITALLAPFG